MKLKKALIILFFFNNLNCYDALQKVIYQIRNLKIVNCPDDGCYLDDINFNEIFTPLEYNSFVHANLPYATIKNAYLKDFNFSNANLSDINFKNSTLVNINFENTDLTNAIFDEAILINTDLDCAKSTANASFARTIYGNNEKFIGPKNFIGPKKLNEYQTILPNEILVDISEEIESPSDSNNDISEFNQSDYDDLLINLE